MTKPLEYLDLEVKYVRHKLTLDNIQYYCFAEDKRFKHKFHSEDHQLNLLCDSSYLLVKNLECFSTTCFNLFEKLEKQLKNQKQKLDNLEEKLEYLKQHKTYPKELFLTVNSLNTKVDLLSKHLLKLTGE